MSNSSYKAAVKSNSAVDPQLDKSPSPSLYEETFDQLEARWSFKKNDLKSQSDNDLNLSEEITFLRQDIRVKNLEIEKRQGVIKGKESPFTLSPVAAATTSINPENPEVQFPLKSLDMEGSLRTGEEDQNKETEDLKLKLKAATRICAQQERHFTSLVKDLEYKLCEAITGRDELLTLRQQESATQQQLIYQLQAALQQTQQTLELRNKDLSDCNNRANVSEEKATEAQSALLKVERQLQEFKGSSESDKIKLIREYENKLINMKTDHAQSLDIAANRTLTERNRIAELQREIDENRLRYEKTISEHERMIASLEENIEVHHTQLDEKTKEHEIQHGKDIAFHEEMQRKLDDLQRDNKELSNTMLKKTSSETNYKEKITLLEGKIKELTLKQETTEKNYKDSEKPLLENVSQLKETLKEKEETISSMNKEHEEEIRLKSDKILSLKKDEGSESFRNLENNHKEGVRQISALKEELRQKTDEVLKFMEEYRALRDRLEIMEKEKSTVFGVKEELFKECESLNKRICNLQEEKSNLSNMVRDNLDDLTRAKNVINSFQVKLDEKNKSLEVFNKQEADLAGLLFQKHLVGESLLQERQQIVRFLEDKVRENDELKGIRDDLAQKLESKIQVLTEMEATCRALERKLEVRSSELEVIMEDRNKASREVENKVVELTKLKEERDSLVTLMNGKQSEKDREISKLLSRLKSSQHDLALTKKVLEAKKEANEKAVKMASTTQEEITAKRKEVDGLKDRIKWLQDSLQATAEEKVHFENRASELASELRNKEQENENIRTELDQMMKYYDDANGQVNQMEMALEKAGIKFAESQAFVEKLEQDLAKIKLQYSLEVKELEMKVKSIEGRGQHVQVLKPFQFQSGDAQLHRCKENMVTTTKQLNATQQRLTDEAEMTEGFKTLLKDLHELMRNIKDSSVMLKRGGSPVEYVVPDKIEGTIEDGFPGKSDGRNTTATVQGPNDESSRSRDDNVTADTLATTEIHAVNSLPGPSTKPKKNGGKELKKKKRASKSLATHAPLHSSSPKRTSPVLDNDGGNEYTAELDYPYSDISDVGSDHDEYRPERNPKLTPKEPNSRNLKSSQNLPRLKVDVDSYVDEDVDSLLMPRKLPPRSHKRAKKILDLLTVKGQELTSGNKKIAELIGRQDDGIKRCRKAEQTIKRILK